MDRAVRLDYDAPAGDNVAIAGTASFLFAIFLGRRISYGQSLGMSGAYELVRGICWSAWSKEYGMLWPVQRECTPKQAHAQIIDKVEAHKLPVNKACWPSKLTCGAMHSAKNLASMELSSRHRCSTICRPALDQESGPLHLLLRLFDSCWRTPI